MTTPPLTHEARPAVAIAILYQNHQFLMQLRDNNPKIIYPGYWAFFGGHLEPDETPEDAVVRELLEEIGYAPPRITLFESVADADVIRHVFHAPLTVPVEQLTLNEGWDLGLFSVEDIQRGDRYSQQARQVRPLGKPHQQILLEFLKRGLLPTESAHE
jgi:8-oxo-dGTP pyrophosphatase MutT (NUDIX family)